MAQILLSWFYITPVCWLWGYLLIRFLKLITKQHETQLPSFSITCFAGLSILTVVSGLLSLFIPLGGMKAQLIIVFPPVLICLANKDMRINFHLQFRTLLTWGSKTMCFFFLLCLFLILVMNSWVITHPDTLGYHLQTVKWIEDFKAVPGLVHLHTRYGYQGLWYVICALFSFKFMHTSAATFVNSTIIAWYVFFIAKEIDGLIIAGTPQRLLKAILYILLFVISCWDFGQVRLTITSLSPDFVAALYVWLIFYLIFNQLGKKNNPVSLLLIFFLGLVAIGIKMSNIAVSVFILYALYKLYILEGSRMMAYLFVIAIITLTPFLARNMIASGYLLFPSTFPDLTNYDWKFSKQLTELDKNYITAYAKVKGVSGEVQIVGVNKMKTKEWVPIWWSNRSYAEIFFLSSLIAILLIAIAFAGRIYKTKDGEKFAISVTATVAGILFWWFTAPDPRFAYGFLIPIQGICLYCLAGQNERWLKLQKIVLVNSILVFCLVIAAYTIYRCKFYFKPQNIFNPSGALQTTYLPVDCGGIKINIPLTENGCGDLPVPCSYNDCKHFVLRGSKITDGFKAAR